MKRIKMSMGERAYMEACILANEMHPSDEPFSVCMHLTKCECVSNYKSPSLENFIKSLPPAEAAAVAAAEAAIDRKVRHLGISAEEIAAAIASVGSGGGSGGSGAAGGGDRNIFFGETTIHLYEKEVHGEVMGEGEREREDGEKVEEREYGSKTPRLH